MNRGMMIAGAILVFGSFSWAAEAVAPQNLSAYLDLLQIKLEHTAQRANQPTASGTHVIGLRGSKQEPASQQLYWKGKPEAASVSPEEVKLFRTAIEEAQAGKKEESAATLRSFIEKYPQSALKDDAEETLRRLSAA